jgi:uroporphyrinogen-III synthase
MTGPLSYHQSLARRRILVTRPRRQAATLCDKLAALGAEPILFPTIEIAPMGDYAALDEALRHLDQYHWVIFTSVNGVNAFWRRLASAGLDNPAGFTGKFAVIGPATAYALHQRGVRAEFIPDEYVAEALVAGIGNVDGQRILLPRAEVTREVLADELSQRGAVVHEIAAYRTLPAAPDPQGLAELRRGLDAITFTSSSTVRNFVTLLGGRPENIGMTGLRRRGPDGLPMASRGTAAIACIGPVTAQTARDVGLPVDVIAGRYTVDGLIAALAAYFARPEMQSEGN